MCNVGTRTGTTAKEVVAAIQGVAGAPFEASSAPRRAADAPVLVADTSKARLVFGWQLAVRLRDIVETASKWHHAERQMHAED